MSYKSTTEASAAPSGAIAARELFGNLLAAEGSPRLIDAWNALHATQQQSDEQEAGDVEEQARDLLAAEYDLDDPDYAAYLRAGQPVDLIDDDARALRAITAALRTKQPAANSSSNELERDVNAAASNLNIAARYAKPEHAKLIVDAISLLRKLSPSNTSKQD